MRGIYIHIPFCRQICHYCDFNKVFIEGQPVDDYIEALIQEMAFYQKEGQEKAIDTVYIGGGTPTTLTPQQFSRLLEGLHRSFDLKQVREFTVEANPGETSQDLLQVLKDYQVDRLSMGVQTFDDRLLRRINRSHNEAQVYETINWAQQVGLTNISIDLIFRLPQQTLDQFAASLDKALALDLPHYSIYALILENRTVFYHLMRQGKLYLPNEDEEADMFDLAMQKMSEAGRVHYEVSNYAKPGFESRHNLLYWDNAEYFGFGAGASGYLNGVRHQNLGPIQHYLKAILGEGEKPILESTRLTKADQMEEELFLGLRKKTGVSVTRFENKYQVSLQEVFGDRIRNLQHQGNVVQEDGFLRLTDQGLLFGNDVFECFLLDEAERKFYNQPS